MSDFELLHTIDERRDMKLLIVKRKRTGVLYTMMIMKKDALLEKKLVDSVLSMRKLLGMPKHPFLCDLKFAFQSSSKLYMVSSFFPGGELTFTLRKLRRFRINQARFIVAEIVLAIGYIHSLGFIHRNLSPKSIFLDAVGHIGLSGLGFCTELGPDERTSTFCGGADYVAPEVVAGGGYGQEVDWWGVGVVLYEMMVGLPPFLGGNDHEVYHKIQHGALRFPPFLTGECRDLIERLLNRNPSERLGAGQAGAEDVKAHPFFASVDWDDLLNKKINPPYAPELVPTEGDGVDLSMYSPFFTSDRAVDFPVEASPLAEAHPGPFAEFDYVGIDTSNLQVASYEAVKPLSNMEEDLVEIES
eukprot:TRINITY_DN11719_c0_g1_i2.p1 TRINITY_DN11719_c0_g1~~TRINITY_DN11719_c0_g1_i2.p1  ORF type:complete len:358 (+),score=76.24 TRINITY_DN11719_c0_g1_i2:3-1076(+)